MKKSIFLVLVLALVLFASCEMPEEDPKDFVDQNLQGRLDSSSFQFASGYADIYSNGQCNIRMYKVDPANGLDPWHTDAYVDEYPYVSFNFDTNDVTQSYSIGFLADILLSSVLSIASDFTMSIVTFDGGQLEITSVDTVNGEVSGRIWATTNEKTSYLNGNFTVPIKP